MSDVPISLYTSVVKLTGENVAPPSLPPSLEETQPAINPPGTSDISGLVPYNGAIDKVNLGEKGLSTGFVQYDTTPTDTPTGAGTVVWNPDKYTLDLSMGLGDSVQQIGMEVYYTPVKNQTGGLIPDGTFVMATGSLGNSGRITVAPAVTDGSVDSKYMLGVTTHDIADGGDGLVTWFGEIRGFNTNTKAPVGETWVDGTVLWNNPAVAGGFTSVEPQAPNLKIPVAIVISAGNNGVIFVRPRLGMRLTDLHDVDAFSPSDKDLISYDSALGHWNAKSLGSVIGGTSSQFLKGDGSLDSNAYALASQINIASGQVAFGTGSGVIGGDSNFNFDNTLKTLYVGTASDSGITIAGRVNDDRITGTKSSIVTSLNTGIGYPFNIIGNLVLTSRKNNSLDIVLRTGASSTNTLVVKGTGLVGILTTSPTNTLDVNGTARIRSLTGTTGYLPLLSSTGVMGQSVVYDNGGNVGIGTATPSDKLQVTGGITFGNDLLNDNRSRIYESFGLNIESGISGRSIIFRTDLIERWRIYNSTGILESLGAQTIRTSTGNLTLATNAGNGNVIISPHATGRVGIDNPNPLTNIHLGGVSTLLPEQSYTNTGEASGLGVNTYTLNTTPFTRYVDFVAFAETQAGARPSIMRWFTQASVPNGVPSEFMRISVDQRLGILTTSPTNTLDVNGTARIRTLSGTVGYLPLMSATGVIGQSIIYGEASVVTVIGRIIGTENLSISGNVSIGTNNLNSGFRTFIQSDSNGIAIRSTGASLGISLNSLTNNNSVFRISNFNNNFYDIQNNVSNNSFTIEYNDVTRFIIDSSGNVGIATTSPTNTLDVNGTARIRSLTGTTGYLPLLSSTGVMGQSVVYNTSAGSVLIGTINEVSGHKVRISGGALNITNWQSSAGAYDKLSIDFGENRGFGYDPTANEIFVKGVTTVPVKIDTDAPTDSLNVLSTGGVEMKNLQAGTISDNIGLNSSGELVKGVAGVVQSVSGTAVDNTDPLNPIISVNNWTGETLIDTITLNDTNGNVTYTCNSTISIYTNSKLNIKTLYLNITNIASSGIPLGGAFEIKGYNFYNFIGANDISVLYEVKEFRGTSYTESLLPLLRPDALGTFDGQLIFRKINNTQQQPPFTSTNGEITIKIAKFKQS